LSEIPERVVAGEAQPWEEAEERHIRPRTLAEYVGQKQLRENLSVFIRAARARQEPLDHCLFVGPPGLGKTTLAHIIAREMGVELHATSGPAVEHKGDLAGLLTKLAPGDVLFIDEIHRLNPAVEEALYPAMEDFSFDFVVGEGPGAKALKLDLQPFTLVGAILGFLWYNAYPAQVFMGDTGALALGATLAVVAMMTGHWLLLPLIGIVFVAETVSVILQVAYFKLSGGKRIFLMSPLHHHFELLGWSEPQVTMRFWLVGMLAAMAGIALALL